MIYSHINLPFQNASKRHHHDEKQAVHHNITEPHSKVNPLQNEIWNWSLAGKIIHASGKDGVWNRQQQRITIIHFIKRSDIEHHKSQFLFAYYSTAIQQLNRRPKTLDEVHIIYWAQAAIHYNSMWKPDKDQ